MSLKFTTQKADILDLKEEDLTLRLLISHPIFVFFVFTNFINLITVISSIFWISSAGFPSGETLGIEILIETWFIFDIIVRLFVRSRLQMIFL